MLIICQIKNFKDLKDLSRLNKEIYKYQSKTHIIDKCLENHYMQNLMGSLRIR